MNKNCQKRPRRRSAIARNFLAGLLLAFNSNIGIAHAATGKLLATGGATTVEGNAGGALVPLALIAGLGTRDEISVTGYGSAALTDDYQLVAGGIAVGLYDRIELSVGRLALDFSESAVADLPGSTISVDTIGVKARLYGDAIYDADSLLPQFSLGARYQKNNESEILEMLDAQDDGADMYLAATKLLFAAAGGKNLLVNGVVRMTKANQLGLLGFGGDRSSNYEPQFEGSVAVFLDRSTIVGTEFRMKPDNIDALGIKEDNWWDVFIGYFPEKNFGVVLGYVELGTVALDREQRGVYLSLQGTL